MSAVRGRGGRGVTALRYRRALVRTAVSAAAAGLPVVPGAWWSADDRRFECDQPGCARTGPHPAVPLTGEAGRFGTTLGAQAMRHPEAVAQRWRRAPYAVLVPTGDTCDVVDVPQETGRTLAIRLDAAGLLGPVIAAGSRWFFLTAPGGRLPAFGGDILVHGQGSWVMLPPSLGPGGEHAGWLSRPSRGGGWVLPARDDLMRCLDLRDTPGQRREIILSATG
jgi:Bifunctional DNA primase/polymerase, N-terminal